MIVVGATGLAGANIALLARKRGMRVRALVRNEDGLDPLRDAGVDFAIGDIRDPDSLERAMQGITGAFHCAAVLGGTWSTVTPGEFWDVNHIGTLNVLDAARKAGVGRVVALDTVGIFDSGFTLTERSPVTLSSEIDTPYISAKRAGFYGGLYRASLGQDIRFLSPGALFGPGPIVERVMAASSFTTVLQRGILGEIETYLDFPMYFSYSPDLAELALRALEHGEPGRRYLGVENAGVSSIAAFCNRGAELAGSPHRVHDIDPGSTSAPDIGSIGKFAKRAYATPYVDNSATVSALGFDLTPRDRAIAETIDWLRAVGKLPEDF
ncbi:NAD-dependent epimerase/dehydratase family protein [Primorskyibacter marinus]|uniref:NAD-dependent epimerase/dehydratase family protein n=1 Tax=Primorskyibacter marinus TaxID=1977320 RepID=UPI001300A6F3|nr:NAD-dependent epimerase/dehydratase family protein [Primorskyibacter marinus]